MNAKTLRMRLKPHLWYQAYWVIYLIWFFWLDLTITDPKYIIHSPVDDLIPFNEWFIFPYCSWFVLLAAVTALLWWFDTASYDKLCLMMFSGMTLCLIIYMVLPNGLDIRPTAEAIGRGEFCHDFDAAHLESRCLGQCLPLDPLPEHGLHGHCLFGQHADKAAPLAQSSGLGVGSAHLRFHRVHQAAFHH